MRRWSLTLAIGLVVFALVSWMLWGLSVGLGIAMSVASVLSALIAMPLAA